jgi:hypothetical protein
MSHRGGPCCAPDVLALVYELVDAHTDTVELRMETADKFAWDAHLDYLRALQRKAQEMLASSHRVANPTTSEWR